MIALMQDADLRRVQTLRAAALRDAASLEGMAETSLPFV